jgi:threonine dehydrogenase-like Zn-dependent dehydrogenase
VKYTAITFTARQTAALTRHEDERPLGADELAGKTLFTLVSPGTELAGIYLGENHPAQPGYAAVFSVEEVGADVKDIAPGDRLFCMGRHQSRQRVRVLDVVKAPAALPSELIPFCRLMGVTMSTLQTTMARPPARVLVTGLGPVGHLGAQVFRAYGYEVIAVDPIEQRRAWAEQAGLPRVYGHVPLDDPAVARRIDLHLECSGHEQAALDGCRAVKKKGEVVLVGAPWERRAELQAHEFLREVFFNYAVLRSGWEWELPHHPADFRQGSIFGNFAEALRLLQERRVVVDGLYQLVAPADCQSVYQELLHRRAPMLFQVFSWEDVD